MNLEVTTIRGVRTQEAAIGEIVYFYMTAAISPKMPSSGVRANVIVVDIVKIQDSSRGGI